MTRLTKKCMVASAGMHALLILVLLVGPAFFSKKPEPQHPIITLVDAKFTDGPTRGGGNPQVTEPPPPQPEPLTEPLPAPPAPAPDPEPQPIQPKPEVVKLPDPPKPEPEKPAPKPEVVKNEPKIQLKPVTRKPDTSKNTTANKSQPKEEPKTQTKQFEFSKVTRKDTPAAQTRPSPVKSTASDTRITDEVRKSIGNIASSIRSSTSSSTSVEMPGPGGEAFVNYRQFVAATYQRAYDQALLRVGEIGERDDSVDVVVVIAKGGRVVSARITRNSGNPALNKLVREVLDSVKSVPGYPEAARDAQRSFNITFDLKSRRLTG